MLMLLAVLLPAPLLHVDPVDRPKTCESHQGQLEALHARQAERVKEEPKAKTGAFVGVTIPCNDRPTNTRNHYRNHHRNHYQNTSNV